MDEIKEKLSGISFPSPEAEAVSVEEIEPEAEQVEEELVPIAVEFIEVAPAESLLETAIPATTGEDVSVALQESIPTTETSEEVSPSQEGEEEKPLDFDQIFSLRPETLVVDEGEEEEDEEDDDKKGKKKKKKKKFVEVVYDPDRDITVVKRKRKRGGDWDDEWNY
jgi:hypothetical protein